jgi:hypothetical protein
LPKFLNLAHEKRAQIYSTVGAELGLTPEILEKDVWVCWALDALFKIDDKVKLAFKGGTSLSKAYDAINRFSEDLDVTIDYASLDPSIDPFDPGLGTKERRRQSDAMIERANRYVREVVEPHFRKLFEDQFPGGGWSLDLVKDGEILNLMYPSVIADRGEVDTDYIREFVKLEFGGRNATTPTETRIITAYLDGHIGELELPSANAEVLSGQRTFLEKVTLAHVECHRGEVKANSERLSRHWYDLYMLADTQIGREAIADRALLEDVIKNMKVFFRKGYAEYDKCLNRQMRIVPTGEALEALRADYEKMSSQSMLYGDIPSFEAIMGRLDKLEEEINA